MKRLPLKRSATALAVTAVLGGGAISMAQIARGAEARPWVQQKQLLATPYDDMRSSDNRALRTFIEDLESSTPEEVHSGQISRFFTNPAAIITNGRMHHVDWNRVRNDRLDDREADARVPEDDRARDEELD